MWEIGPNLKDLALAAVACVGTVAGYYFGYKRASNINQIAHTNTVEPKTDIKGH